MAVIRKLVGDLVSMFFLCVHAYIIYFCFYSGSEITQCIVKNWDVNVHMINFKIHDKHLDFFRHKKSEKTTHLSYNEFKFASTLVSILTRDLIKLYMLFLSAFPSLSL